MSFDVMEAAVRQAFAEDLPAAELSVVWHAGEPLAMPKSWYLEAFRRIDRLRPSSVRLRHHIQTNAVLIDTDWCYFFRTHDVRVGISLDGPGFLHDSRRKTRDGKGTHAKVMRGVDNLNQAGISFHVICVLTRNSLAYPDEIFDFFAALNIRQLCFNIEEIEAENSSSSLQDDGVEEEFRAFFRRIVERLKEQPNSFRIREIDAVLSALRDPAFGTLAGNTQNRPGFILTVGWEGSFSTWSPELLGQNHPIFGNMALGNVLYDEIASAIRSERFAAMQAEIDAGTRRCRADCKYFDFCLGGAPSNKLAETGSFDATETMFCRFTQKAIVDVVLEMLDHELPASSPTN
jgi:uncharacterized protein